MHRFFFEKLDIWNLSIALSVRIYQLTLGFPPEEKFGLSNQLRRASNSISANIAEGTSRQGNKEKARYIQIAYSSLLEVLNHLILSERLKFITAEEYSQMRSHLEELSNKINAFHQKLISSIPKKSKQIQQHP